MPLFPYQHEFVEGTRSAFREFNRVLSVMATGGGKTVCAAEIIKNQPATDRTLFLADAKLLVNQTADKIAKWTGLVPAIEMAESHARPDAPVVVATTQTMHGRLDKYPSDHFQLIIVDEAHRNSLGQMAAAVLTHFEKSKVLGMTATPMRSDHRQLGSFYQTIGADIGLVRLIKEGFLTRLRIKNFPLKVDLSDVRTTRGDYSEDDLDHAITPHLELAAKLLAEIAPFRKTVTFLPLRSTSMRFAEICKTHGLDAVHVDGADKNLAAESISQIADGRWDVICNAQLLSTGWDCPEVDSVLMLRPTRSVTLYSQCIGRITRKAPGKPDAWILDPMFISDRLSIVKPAQLIAGNEQEIESIEEKLKDQEDLLNADASATEAREEALRKELEKAGKKKSRDVDAVDFLLSVQDHELLRYEPCMPWHGDPVTEKQASTLAKFGITLNTIKNKGHANAILNSLFSRSRLNLASPKQVRLLTRFRHPAPHQITRNEAKAWIDQRLGVKPKPQKPQKENVPF